MNIINISDNKSEVGGKRKHMLSRFERTTSSSTSSSRIWWQSSNKRIQEAIFTGRRLFASLSGDFQVFFAPRSTFFFTFAGSLTSTRTDSSTRESFVGWPLLQWSVHKSYKPSFRFWILCSGSDVFKQYILKKKYVFLFRCQTVNISFRDATRTRTENLISKSSKRWLQGSCKIGEKKSQHLERQKLVEKVIL